MPSTDEMLLTLDCDCYENNKSFMFNFNISTSNEDLDKTYIQNNKSNESMNRWYHTPCNAMQSFISRLCINKSKCLIKLNDFINSNDRCVDGKKNLSIQFLCGRIQLSSSLSLSSSSSSSQEFTNTKVTYIFTLNTYNISSVTNKDKDIDVLLQYRYNYSESIFFTIDDITDKSSVESTVAAVTTLPPLLQQASSPILKKTMKQKYMKSSDIITTDEPTAITSTDDIPTGIATKERSAYPQL
jgi:hypothetical protein